MNYLKLLENSYNKVSEVLEGNAPESRLEYLSDYIFQFTTYDGEMSELFAAKAIEVCEAINNRTTFEYIKEPNNYRWYLLMCNMPFFADKLDWGTSIRGAWWYSDIDKPIDLHSWGLWLDEQTELAEFTAEEWKEFIEAIIEFADLTTPRFRNTITDH